MMKNRCLVSIIEAVPWTLRYLKMPNVFAEVKANSTPEQDEYLERISCAATSLLISTLMPRHIGAAGAGGTRQGESRV